MVDGGGVCGHESSERDACGTKFGGIDFRAGEEDVVGADSIGAGLLKSREESLFCTQDKKGADEAAALTEIRQLDEDSDATVFCKKLADFAFQLEIVWSDGVENLHGGGLAVGLCVQGEVKFTGDGIVQWKVCRDGGRELDGKAATIFKVLDGRHLHIKSGAEGGLFNMASFGEDCSGKEAKK